VTEPIDLRRLALAVLAALAVPRVAAAQDEFEIQVYDVETAPRGEVGLEVHLNEHLLPGVPDQTHVTFEPHYGLRDWLELGGYFQASLDDAGDLEYAGVKLRAKLRRPGRAWHDRLGLAINFELSDVPARFEANQYGSEVRPIADLRVGAIYAAVNPIVSTDLAGALRGRPQLEPAAKLAYVMSAHAMVGVELYGAYGAVTALGDENVGRAFAVVDLQGDRWDVNFGVGATYGIDDHPIAKLIVGLK
jgi:hypothetical protein